MKNLSISFQNFNNRIKQMNQTNARQMTLSADEARNLHSDIFALLSQLADVNKKEVVQTEAIAGVVNLDAGRY